MNCPICKTSLVMRERSGVEIDYCPTCRGVWLDRGELDKIIERAGNHGEAHQQKHHDERVEEQRRDRDHDDNYNRHSNDHSKKHRKENFLGDLFDF